MTSERVLQLVKLEKKIPLVSGSEYRVEEDEGNILGAAGAD